MKRAIPVSVLALALAGGAFFLLSRKSGHVQPAQAIKTLPPPLPSKKSELQKYVDANQSKPDPQVQDRVGAARIRIAYAAASKKDWEGARRLLLQTASQYKGTNATSSDFGGVADQARYQAAVCLIAEGKKRRAGQRWSSFCANSL